MSPAATGLWGSLFGNANSLILSQIIESAILGFGLSNLCFKKSAGDTDASGSLGTIVLTNHSRAGATLQREELMEGAPSKAWKAGLLSVSA